MAFASLWKVKFDNFWRSVFKSFLFPLFFWGERSISGWNLLTTKNVNGNFHSLSAIHCASYLDVRHNRSAFTWRADAIWCEMRERQTNKKRKLGRTIASSHGENLIRWSIMKSYSHLKLNGEQIFYSHIRRVSEAFLQQTRSMQVTIVVLRYPWSRSTVVSWIEQFIAYFFWQFFKVLKFFSNVNYVQLLDNWYEVFDFIPRRFSVTLTHDCRILF